MNTAYLLLGGNEGDRLQWLNTAIEMIDKDCGEVTKKSAFYETAAWGLEEQPAFLNMALCLQTKLSATDLLKATNNIENILGRQRTVKWGQRTLDIDILFFNDELINLPELKVPHPQLENRRFALIPLNEIAPKQVHPVSGKKVEQLLQECTDKLEVTKYSVS